MLIGRFIAGFIANKISSKTMLTCTAAIAIVFLIFGMVFGKSTMIDMPVYADNAFKTVNVPIAACFLCFVDYAHLSCGQVSLILPPRD